MKCRIGWILLLLLLSSGCTVQTKDPLSDPHTAELDKSLLGHWLCKEANGAEDIHLFIGRNRDKANPSALLEFTTINWDQRSEKLGELMPRSFATATKIGNSDYLNVIISKLNMDVPADKPFSYKKWEALETRRVAIVRYECDGQTLQLWSPEMDLKEVLVKSGQLKAEGNVVTTESLVKYLTDHGGETLFAGKSSTFTKVP